MHACFSLRRIALRVHWQALALRMQRQEGGAFLKRNGAGYRGGCEV